MNRTLHDNGVGIDERRCRVKKVLDTFRREGIFDATLDVMDEKEEGVELEREAASESRAADEFTQEARIRHKQIELGIRPDVFQKPSTEQDSGDSRLHKAVLMNDPTSVKLFLEQGDDPDVKDNNGETPYEVAIGEENVALIKIFEGQ